MLFKKLALKLLNRVVYSLGYNIIERGLGYFDPKTLIADAENESLSVGDYLEKYDLAGVGKRRDQIIRSMSSFLAHQQESILEIGAGTGMFLEKIIETCHPEKVEIYETSVGWRDYLEQRYASTLNIVCHNADGKSLSHTPDQSIDTVFAHGVFVYLPLINTFSYLIECVRVVKAGGLIIFDCFSDQHFTLETIVKWQKDIHVFPVVISRALLIEFFKKHQLEELASFQIPYHSSDCTYYILRKQ